MDVLTGSQIQFLRDLQEALFAVREAERQRAQTGPPFASARASRARERSRSRDSNRDATEHSNAAGERARDLSPSGLLRHICCLRSDCESLGHRVDNLCLGRTHLMNTLLASQESSSPFSAISEFVLDTRASLRTLHSRLDELTRVAAETAMSTALRLDRCLPLLQSHVRRLAPVLALAWPRVLACASCDLRVQWTRCAHDSSTMQGASNGCSSDQGPRIDFEALLSAAVDACASDARQPAELPWEHGVFKSIFEPSDVVGWEDTFMLPDLPVPDDPEEILPPSEKKRRLRESGLVPGVCFSVVRKSHGISWQDQRDKDHDKAMARWTFVILRWADLRPDLLICKSLLECATAEERTEVLRDWLHPKAPSTLLKRVNSLLRFHKSEGWSDETFPYEEGNVYKHMVAARAGGAKPAQMRALREALIFVRHVFSVEEIENVISSRRCLGAASRGARRKARQRADPLTLKNLRLLHSMLGDKSVPAWDRVFAGAALCCAYMRSRWSDFQHSISCGLEYGADGERLFLEFTCEDYKTVNSKFFAGAPLRMIAPGRGIAGPNWLDLWHEARMEVGLTEFVPPLPTPGPAGEPTGASVTTEEMSLWLQKIFVDRGSLRTSGHTLKRTFLTMATKRGVEHLDRLVLGGHANSAGMADTYGDDELARPLRLLMALISEIREGVFDPDAGRAGYLRGSGLEELRLGFAAQTDDRHPPSAESWERVTGDDDMFGLVDALDKGAPSQPDVFFPGDDDANLMGQDSADEPPEAEVGDGGVSSLGAEDDKLVGKDSDSSSSSGSSDSSDSSGSDDEPARIMPPPEPAEGTTFLQHQRTRLLHMIADNNRRVLMCGRMVSDLYSLPQRIRFDSSVCRNCKKAVADTDLVLEPPLGGNMSLVDSEASFRQRCQDVGGGAIHTALSDQGITSFASLAYSCGTPQDRPTQAEMDAFAVKILGAAPRLGDVSILKRLMFESATYVIAQSRQAVQGDSAEQPRKLPLAEKQARAEDQRRRLSGVHIERDLVPSHALVDLCCHMHDVGITWISPGKCTSRESEIQLSTKDQSKIFRLEDNSLKVGSEQPKDIASYDSPIKLQWCLQRRGLALDQAKVLTWAQHERWVHCLLHALTKECPPGFHKPDMNRIVQADREAWLIMASEVPSLKPSTAGEYPLGKALDALRTDPRITMYLMATWGRAPDVKVQDLEQGGYRCQAYDTRTEHRPRLRETHRAALGVSMFVLTVAVWATPSVIAELALGRAAAISGYGPHSVGFHFPPAATSEVADVLAPAEAIALQCLQAGFASHDDFRSLIALLPADTAGAPSEESVDPTAPKSFTSGAYVHQAKAGLRCNFHAFPFSTMLLAAVLSASFGFRCFSSVGLFLNLKAPLHNDANNDHAHPNLILPASVFHKGQIWVEGKGECPCPDPDVPRLGYLLPVADGPQLLPSERLHATCDWDGTRLLIVGFCIRDTGLLSEAHRVRLLDARFLLPQVESGSASDAVLPVPPPKRPKEAFPQQATPLVIEIFAGTARLSTACQKLGFRTLAIDKSTARGRFPIQRLDLTDADDLCILLDIIRLEAANIVWIHCAPPCGTASAARSRPIPELTAAGVRVPQPLRSTSEPQGLSTLTGADLERVQKANMLYRAVGQIADLARQLNIFVTVENPRNSLAWLCDGLDELFRSPHHTVVYDACVHGGTRDKTTLLWCSADWFQPLALRCSRDHQHASWKPRLQPHATSFPTADEAAYPVLLCERMAHIIAARAGGLALAAPDPQPMVVQSEAHLKHDETVAITGFIAADDPCSEHAEIVSVGIPKEPCDFVADAVKAGHPRNALNASREGPSSKVADAILMDFERRERLASKTKDRWSQIAATTKPLNHNMLKHKPDYIVTALGDKNLLAWKSILGDNGFPDQQLWSDLRDGLRLTGWMRDTGIFDKKVRPPQTSLEHLLSQSQYQTPLTLKRLQKTVVDITARKAWAETVEEEKKGWIFREESANLDDIVLAHRFGLQQKDKVRVIDNGKECGLNLACGLPEKFTLHGVDVLAGVFIELLNRPEAAGKRIKGKTIDLVSAYKFYPIHPQDRRHLRIGVYDTDSGMVRIYGTNVLPFGATGSVAGFLRVSAAIWHTGIQDLGLGWCAYFDDFPLMALEGHEDQVGGLAGEVFDALGIQYAKEGKKATDFDYTFAALGLQYDLTRFNEGVVVIRHTEARTAELVETLEGILRDAVLRPKDAEVLRGRMHWFTSYLFGRAPCEAMRQISLRAQCMDSCTRLNDDLTEAIQTLLRYVADSRPLELRQTTGRELYVFTDGSYEPTAEKRAGIGGVLYDSTGTPLSFFSAQVNEDDLRALEETSDHPIYEVELYAALVAVEIWGPLLEDSFSVFFLDNEAAQSALIAGRSGTDHGRKLVQRFLDAEHRWRARPWFGRVPTHSNPADEPSRDCCKRLLNQGAQQMQTSGERLLV
ncbi:unnamed protein product [Symbiodinium sp. CCMP2592]|nr:unnamed protein product [Symbiodinium sp. CCMP2592]